MVCKQIFVWKTSILNAKVTPIGELDNPIGDWLQVAEQIKVLLEKSTKQERETDISLLKIEPDKRKKSAKLTFTFMGDDLTSTDLKEYCYWYVYITVTEDGRIIDYQRDTELV